MTDEDETLNPAEEFGGLLYQLDRMPYGDIGGITAVEQSVYKLLNRFQQDLRGLIILLRVKIMLGDRNKAVATAEQIWEIGGSLDDVFEEAYIDSLLDLGLLEMASVLLKPRFENLAAALPFFYPVMLKFTIIGGSIKFMEKLTSSPHAPRREDMLFDFIEVYRLMNYGEHFKNIQRLILDNAKSALCGYGYQLYNDRGFTDLELVLYLDDESARGSMLKSELEVKINAYCASAGVKRANNLSVVVRSVAAHPARVTAERQEPPA